MGVTVSCKENEIRSTSATCDLQAVYTFACIADLYVLVEF